MNTTTNARLTEIDRIDARLAEITAEGYSPSLHLAEWTRLCNRRWRAYDALPGGWGYDVPTSAIRQHYLAG